MLRVFIRRSGDASYLASDPALELDGLRDGDAGWWLRGAGDTRRAGEVERVFTTTPRSRVVGYDLVLAAPRPISILLALDPEHGSGVVAAHRASVAATVSYLEERSLVVRDRRGDEQRDLSAKWERIVSFTHGVNRHGEPHLHDHVLVGARPAGEGTVLDGRSLFAHVPTADALYRTSMRHELAARTPWRAWRSFNGVELVEGLDEGYRALWGGHHDGRGQKVHWRRDEAVSAWRGDLARLTNEGVIGAPRDVSTLDEHSFAGALEGRSDVTRRHLVAAWANAAVSGQRPHDVGRSIDRLYPELAASRGVREHTIGVAQARMTSRVREQGPRPLHSDEFADWVYRSRDRSRSRSDRSR